MNASPVGSVTRTGFFEAESIGRPVFVLDVRRTFAASIAARSMPTSARQSAHAFATRFRAFVFSAVVSREPFAAAGVALRPSDIPRTSIRMSNETRRAVMRPIGFSSVDMRCDWASLNLAFRRFSPLLKAVADGADQGGEHKAKEKQGTQGGEDVCDAQQRIAAALNTLAQGNDVERPAE